MEYKSLLLGLVCSVNLIMGQRVAFVEGYMFGRATHKALACIKPFKLQATYVLQDRDFNLPSKLWLKILQHTKNKQLVTTVCSTNEQGYKRYWFPVCTTYGTSPFSIKSGGSYTLGRILLVEECDLDLLN